MENLKVIYDVSVIIPTYNRSKLLSYTLDSLLKQNIDKNRYEIIIADDGSTDDTRRMLAKYELLMNIKYVFQEDKGYRPASARNKAILLAEGKICLFIDASVIVDANCLAEHIRFHSRSDSPVSAIGYVYGFDHSKESENLLISLVNPSDPDISFKRLLEYQIFRDVREEHYIKYNDKIEHLRTPWFYFWTCHLSAATEDLKRVGLFDECYDGRWGIEDVDLGLRLHQDGVQISLLRTARAIHYPHCKDKIERDKEGYQNSIYFHNKFNTLETRLYLENYGRLVDINEMCLNLTPEFVPL
jgi:glycosyltransferase involved in cell wall biosynthesis